VAPQGPGVRFDSGVETGSEVTLHYDPLIAKVIAWGASRGEAIARMRGALQDTVVLGVCHNGNRLREILEHAAFAEGRLHTGFLEENLAPFELEGSPPEALAAALCALSVTRGEAGGGGAATSDPWSSLGGWRLR